MKEFAPRVARVDPYLRLDLYSEEFCCQDKPIGSHTRHFLFEKKLEKHASALVSFTSTTY